MPGRLFLVVGPSGAGKDTLLDGARRLARKGVPYPAARAVERVANDGTPAEGVARFVAALTSARRPALVLKRMPIDSWNDDDAFLHRRCPGYRADRILAADEIGLSRRAFERLGLPEGAPIGIERARRPASPEALRAKAAGRTLDPEAIAPHGRGILGGSTGRRTWWRTGIRSAASP